MNKILRNRTAGRSWLGVKLGVLGLITSLGYGQSAPASAAGENPMPSPPAQSPAPSSASVYGAVVRPAGGPPVSGLVVVLAGTDKTSATDSYGRFHLSAVPPGTYSVLVSGAGYNPLRITGIVVQPATDTNVHAATMVIAPKTGETTETEVKGLKESDVLVMDKFQIQDRTPFSDNNVDLVRTMNDAQPYYIFQTEDLKDSGAANLEDFLDQRLPMNTNVQPNSAKTAEAAGATSDFNLRGFGANQTLILINGHRIANAFVQAGLSGTNQPDLNGIPLEAIDHIDIIPTSAAAVYGAGAVGGVVNVVLKNDYTGGNVTVKYNNTLDTDAPQRSIDATYGLSLEGGKTHVLISGHYDDGKNLRVGDRTFIGDYLAKVLQNNPSQLESISSPYPGSTPNISSGNAKTNLILKNGTPLNSPITYIPVGYNTTSSTSALVTDAGQQNFNNVPAPYVAYRGGFYDGLGNIIGQPERIKSLNIDLTREMTSNLEAFIDYGNESDTSLTFINRNKANASVPASAPDNPFQEAVVVSYPSNLPMPYYTDYVTWRVTGGVIATLPADWKAEADYTWTALSAIYKSGTMDTTLLSAAYANGTVNPFVDTLANPLNLTPYIGTQINNGNAATNDYELRLAGPVLRLPAGEMDLTVGGEHRKEGWHNQPTFGVFPTATDSDELQFLGLSQSITSEFTELKVPVFSAANGVPGIQLLDFDLAARDDQYSVATGTASDYLFGTASQLATNVPVTTSHSNFKSNNYSGGLRYKPVKGLMFRASYGVSTVPPSVSQLDPIINTTFNQSYTDPLRGNGITAFVPNVTSVLEGGNPNLQPETADSWNAGIVLEPTFLKGLRLSVDWFDIKKKNQITTLSYQQVINGVAQGILPSNLVARGPLTASDQAQGFTGGPITFVNFAPINLANAKIEGYDVTVDYRKPTPAYGTFDFSVIGTFAQHVLEQTSAGGPFIDLIGVPSYGSTPQPPVRFRGDATLKWDFRNWTVGWTSEYTSSYYENGPPYNTSTTFDQSLGNTTIPSQIYHDIFGSYKFGDYANSPSWVRWGLAGMQVTVGIKDLFNTAPPFDPWYNNAGGVGYYASPYGDIRLRQYWIQLSRSF